MPIAHSKLTTQGQISVPVEVRRRLGLEPGSVIEWSVEGGQIVVRPAGRFTSEEIHKKVFPDGTPGRVEVGEMKAGVGKLIRKRRASGRY
jgi:AbrB family looped-hinge helix DNA binding protein